MAGSLLLSLPGGGLTGMLLGQTLLGQVSNLSILPESRRAGAGSAPGNGGSSLDTTSSWSLGDDRPAQPFPGLLPPEASQSGGADTDLGPAVRDHLGETFDTEQFGRDRNGLLKDLFDFAPLMSGLFSDDHAPPPGRPELLGGSALPSGPTSPAPHTGAVSRITDKGEGGASPGGSAFRGATPSDRAYSSLPFIPPLSESSTAESDSAAATSLSTFQESANESGDVDVASSTSVDTSGTTSIETAGEPMPAISLGFADGLEGWTIGESGGSEGGRGSVTAGSAMLTEGDSFLVTMERPVTVPDQAEAIRFRYTDLTFDTTDPDSINDAFEVALLDTEGNTLVHTFAPGRDAFFNVTEGETVLVGAGTTVTEIDVTTVDLDITGLFAATEGTLEFRLVNNDSDTATEVTILDVAIIGADQPPSISAGLADDTAPQGPGNDPYLSDGLTNDTTISGTVSDDAGVDRLEVSVDGGPFADITSSLTGDQFVYDPGVLPAGAHSITLRATDTLGQTRDATVDLTVNAPPTADAGGNRTVLAGANVQFDASASTDSEAAIHAYEWTFDDATTTDGAIASRTYPSPGTFPVTLTVTDTAGSQHSTEIEVVVQESPQVTAALANDTAPSDAPFNSPLRSDLLTNDATIIGMAADDAAVVQLEAIVDVGSPIDITTSLVGSQYTYDPGALSAGLHSVAIRATDANGLMTEQTVTFTVNSLPTADAGGNRTVSAGATVQFDASASTDTEAAIHAYEWTFEDGTTADAATASRTYPNPGTFPVTLTVTDTAGSQHSTEIQVVVQEAPQVTAALANDTAPSDTPFNSPLRSDLLTNDATIIGTAADDAAVVQLEAIVDVGSPIDITTSLVGSQYTYDPGALSAGLHSVAIRATDANGLMTEQTVTFTVNAPPTADAGGNQTVLPGASVQFDGSASTDTEAAIHAYEWTFDDGTTVDGATASRTYASPGTFPVALTVTDTAGSEHSTQIQVTVEETSDEMSPVAQLDDGGWGFRVRGIWTVESGGWQGDYRTQTPGSGSRYASWMMRVPAGRYEIYANWPGGEGYATDAPYRIIDGRTVLDSVLRDQSQPPGDGQYDGLQWGSLGVYDIATGVVAVELRDTFSSGMAVADGIVLVPAGSPLHASTESTTVTSDGVLLTPVQLEPIAAQAIANWSSDGQDESVVDALAGVDFLVTDLSGSTLGLASPGVVWIDQDAAAHGWFIDSTPAAHEEFQTNFADHEFVAGIESPAAGRMDLLTVLSHEFGHLLGREDLAAEDHPHDLMAESLTVGVRRLPATADSQLEVGAPVSGELNAETSTDSILLSADIPTNDGRVAADDPLLVTGRALPVNQGPAITHVTVNGVPVEAIDAAGNFFAQINPPVGQTTLAIVATNESGDKAEVTLTVTGVQVATTSTALEALDDVSGSLVGEYARTSFQEDSNVLYTGLSIRNAGGYPADVPLLVGITNLGDPSVRVIDFDGQTPDGIPYIDLSELVDDATLSPGEATGSRTLSFSNPNRVQFDYDLGFLGRLNEAPAITTVPDVEAIAGRTYSYDVDATDANDDSLTYSLLSGPEGATIDPSTGQIDWQPLPHDIGSHSIVVRLEDARGGSTQQSYTLSVIEPPPNRPPVFTSVPVVDGIVDSSYDYTAAAENADGDALTFTLDVAPAGMQIDPASGLISWELTGAQVGEHVVAIQVEDGRGGVARQEYAVAVHSNPANAAPVFTTTPPRAFELPGELGLPDGDVQPQLLALDLENGEITTETVSLTLPPLETGESYGDIVFLVDESGSMEPEQEWIGEMIFELDAALEAKGIGPNRYMLVGYGRSFNERGRVFHVNLPDEVTVYGPDSQVVGTQTVRPGNHDVWTETLVKAGQQVIAVGGSDAYEFLLSTSQVSTRPLALGELVHDSVPVRGVDRYEFTLAEESQLFFDAQTTDRYSVLRWSLEGPRGVEVENRGMIWYYDDRGNYLVDPLPAGDYVLTVEAGPAGQVGGEYAFRLSDLRSATTLVPGTPVHGSLDPPKRANLYRFGASVGDQVRLESQGGGFFTRWRLVDPLGEEIFTDERFADDVTVTLQTSGEYTLAVEGTLDGPVDYTVNVEPLGNVPPDPFTGSPITLGETVSDSIAVAGEEDRFTFSLAAPSELFLDVQAHSYVEWTLEGGEGVVVSKRGLISSNPCLELPAGSYQLTINGRNNYTGDYSFRLNERATIPLMTPGTPESATLDSEISPHLYRFPAAAGEPLFLDIQQGSSAHLNWTLVDPYGRVETRGNFHDDVEGVSLDFTGEYVLLVESASSLEFPYDYAFNLQPVTLESRPLVLGDTTSDSIALAAQQHQYTFSLADAALLSFDSLTADSALRWSLDGSQGNVVSQRGFHMSDGQISGVSNPVLDLPGGDYVLTVDASGDATGSYAFRMNDLNSAAPLMPGTPITDDLSPGNETHLYRFSASAGDRYYFDIQNGADFGVYWRLIDPNGHQVFGEEFSADVDTQQIAWTGQYTLLLEGDVYATTDHSYALNVQPVTFGSQQLTLGDSVSDTISVPGEQHEYSFAFTDPALLYFDALDGSNSVRWSLDGPRGFEVSDQASSLNRVLPVPAGNYVLSVDALDDVVEDYAFRLSDLHTVSSISPDVPFGGSLEPDNQSALYRFEAVAGDQFFFDVQEGATNYAAMRLVDPFGGYVVSYGALSDYTPQAIKVSGTYVLIIEPSRSLAASHDYTINVELVGNDPPEPAIGTPLTLGATTSGAISVGGEADFYVFTLAEPTRVYFDSLTNDASLTWTLSGPRGEEASRRFSQSDGSYFTSPMDLPAGDYRLEITASPGATGDYSFRLHDLGDAPVLSPGTPVSGAVTKETEVYLFSALAGERVYVDVQQGEQQQVYLRLCDPYGTAVVNRPALSDAETAPLPVDGEYTLLVEGSIRSNTAIDYTVAIQRFNDTSQPLTFDTEIHDAISVVGERHEYTFDVDVPQLLFFDGLNGPNVMAAIYDPYGQLVEGMDADENSKPFLTTVPGTYRIVLSGYPDSVGDYGFRLLDVDDAPVAQIGEAVHGDNGPDGRDDVFRFEGAEGLQLVALPVPSGNFGNALQFSEVSDSLIAFGAYEDGLEAIHVGLSHDTFREDAAINMVLVTDEGRTEVEPTLTFESTFEDLLANDAVLNAVLNAPLADGDAQPAVGVDSDGNALLPDGVGGFQQTAGGHVVNGPEEYIDLAWGTEGAVWDLNRLRSGGAAATSFSEAFVEIKTQEIAQQFGIDLIASDPSIAFENLSGLIIGGTANETVSFDAQLTGDGLPHVFDLLFVRPNTGTVLGSIPVAVNATYQYPSYAVDPDGDTVTYALLTGPADASINEASGRISWLPHSAGEYEFEIQAADSRGGVTTQDFTVTVGTGLPNNDPIITTTAPTRATIGVDYEYPVAAEDPDDDRVSYFLVESPEDMSIDPSSGVISWTPALDQFGGHTVTVRALDGRGGAESQTYSIDVGFDDANESPAFQSTAPQQVMVGNAYRYDPLVTDVNGDPLSFDLAVQPSGSVIDPEAGTIVWSPSVNQIGDQSFVIRVRDGRGGVALQSFQVDVSGANTAPVITSTPPDVAVVGRLLESHVRAQDADSDDLIYQLQEAPSGMSIDANTRLLQWTPTAAQIGPNSVLVVVTDGRGGQASQSFDLEVVADSSNRAPVIHSAPRDQIQYGRQYLYAVEATDADGDSLALSLDLAPSGMNIDASGLVSWMPSSDQLGDHDLVIRVDDGQGDVVTQEYSLAVSDQLENTAPDIVSAPSFTALVGQTYAYDAQAVDIDNDTLFWNLAGSPAGMSIDPRSGAVRWTPTLDQLGRHELAVQVVDGLGGNTTQTFSVEVRSVNVPPAIVSTARTQAFNGQAYRYSVAATDVEDDPLTFSVDGPAGMTIDAISGLLAWTPASSDAGLHSIEVSVSDGFSVATQQYELDVSLASQNHPPTITSAPALVAAVDHPYEYQLTASDPDDDPLTLQLLSAPSNMTVDASGRIQWTPSSAQVGAHPVVIGVADPAALAAEQRFTIDVVVNDAPTITSEPTLPVTTGDTYRYDILAEDADGDPLSYALVDGPAGMTIDQLGRIQWATGLGSEGTHPVTVEVSDGRSGVATQAFDLVVDRDASAPLVEILIDSNPVDVGSTALVLVQATDDVGIVDVDLTIDGVSIALDANRSAFLATETVGDFEIVATAADATGNQGIATTTLNVVAPNDGEAPLVAIDNIEDGDVIMSPTEILGTVDDADLQYYTLSAAPLGGEFVEFFRGESTVAGGTLGTFDPSVLANDDYRIELRAVDAGGNSAYVRRQVSVAGDLKLGNFTLSFTDLTVPAAGIPISVARTYDSLDARREGEFGFGWRMEFRDVHLRTSVPATGLEDLGVYGAFKRGTRVFVTLPGGRREGFTFEPQFAEGYGQLLGLLEPRFEPDPGVTSRLTVPEGLLLLNSDGSLGGSSIPYNPLNPAWAGFLRLTTPEGVDYIIDGPTGKLNSAIDNNGNALLFSENGITTTAGEKSIDIERDPQGRIDAVVDPNGNRIEYAYDADGNLVSVTDRERNTTRLRYEEATRPHYLTEVVDPLGHTGVRTEYDDQGRLLKMLDANGEAIEFGYDPDNSTVTVKDQLGYPTKYVYDAIGNVVTEIDPEGGVTHRTYEDAYNPTLETSVTDPEGNTTQFEYDQRGNVVVEVDPNGDATRTTYDHFNTSSIGIARRNVAALATAGPGLLATLDALLDQPPPLPFSVPATVTDPLGNTTTNAYDQSGRLLSTVDPTGLTTAITYLPSGILGYSSGLPEEMAIGSNITKFEYDASGNVTRQEDAEGTVRTFTYDALGNQLTETVQFTTPGGPSTVVTENDYDADGRVIKTTTKQDGVVLTTSETVFDALGNRVEEIDALGRRTKFVYDNRGQLTETIYPDDTPLDDSDNPRTTTEYDAAGQVTAEIDELGRVTRFEYDKVGRETKTIFPDDTPLDDSDNPFTETVYDAAGRSIAEIDERGNRTEFVYDAAGNRTMTILPDATPGDLSDNPRITSVYDEAGRRVSTTDPLGHTTTFVFDDGGRPTKTLFADGTSTASAFDDQGRLTGRTDQNENTTHYEYDDLGRLTAVVQTVDGTDLRTEYGYDELGNLVTQMDAELHTTTFEYDGLGRRIATVLPLGQRSETAYDEVGRAASTTDFNGDAILFEYDARNRLVEKDFPSGPDTTFTYTLTGQRETVTDGRGVTTFEYDTRDRLLARTDPDESKVFYTYDAAGNRTSVTTQVLTNAPRTTEYTFDELNRPETVTDPEGGLTTYFYDAFGRTIGEIGSTGNLYLFAGEQRDLVIGFDYLRARWMDTGTGRFFVSDTFPGYRRAPITVHRYLYGNANPINATDPQGLFSIGDAWSTIPLLGHLRATSTLRVFTYVGAAAYALIRVVDEFNSLTDMEQDLIKERPVQALGWAVAAKYASWQASYRYEKSCLYDGNGDAFRHAYWNALMVRIFGSVEDARTWANAHETGTYDAQMDLFNNHFGRFIGIAGERLELDEEVEKAVSTGLLRRLDESRHLIPTDGTCRL